MLYDREVVVGKTATDEKRKAVLEVYKFVGLSMLAAAVGAYVGYGAVQIVSEHFLWFVLLEFAAMFSLVWAREKPGLNIVMLFVFTFMTGFTMAPMLAAAIHLHPGVLTNAFLATGVAVGSASLYGATTERDTSGWNKYLFPILIGVVVVGLLNLFIQSSGLSFILSLVSVVLFTFYLIYDTQRVIQHRYADPIMMAVSVYLDILNIFLSILNILMSLDRR